VEYAEEYSKPEKYKRIILALLLGVLSLIINEKWYLPFISWYADTVYCHTPFGYSGISVMWYSLFVGIPIVCALIIGPFTFPVGYKGLIDEQFPPKGYKVFAPTKIVRGWKSKFKSIFLMSVPIFLILVSVWGYFQVNKMPQDVPKDFDYSVCES
tara:strand:- start:132 stop:596 length:465 start_codon:yes stop_codon:yes gene_type:complete